MQASQLSWAADNGWRAETPADLDVGLVVYFGSRDVLASPERHRELTGLYPNARVLGCSTGGQIADDIISDDTIAGVAMSFEDTPVKLARAPVDTPAQSRSAGETIGKELAADDLRGVFVLSDGLRVNGSELVAGIRNAVGSSVSITGGLAGDDDRFEETLVAADSAPRSGVVGAVGFYGNAVRIGHGSAGGWDVFGPSRRITRSSGNVLMELDGEPALDLYARYLGEEETRELPGSALLFPLRIRNPENPDHQIVRTILGIDRDANSMTFAGDMPEGWTAQLMHGTFDRLADGAATAARQANACSEAAPGGDNVALLVSCIGRRLLMGEYTDNEVEAARAEFEPDAKQIGFYSYGEISPHAASGMCELHNQTMTVTTLCERLESVA